MCTLRADSGLHAKPRHLEQVIGFTSFRLRFGGVLRGRFVPRTRFDCVPAGTVLAGTRLFRTRSDYKKWCVPRTCSENMFLLELYWEQVWTPVICMMKTDYFGEILWGDGDAKRGYCKDIGLSLWHSQHSHIKRNVRILPHKSDKPHHVRTAIICINKEKVFLEFSDFSVSKIFIMLDTTRRIWLELTPCQFTP